MKDRAALLPNRRKITYEDGSVDFVTFEYADQPTEVGTVLGKNALLSDAAVAAVGLSQTDPVPSDAFTKLGIFTNAVSSNLLINGGFDIWQRGTSQTTSGYGSDDRWNNLNTTSTKTNSRQTFTIGQTEVPCNPTYYSRTVVVSGGTANSRVSKLQYIEGVDRLSGLSVTLSFYAKADANKNISVEFAQNFGSGGSSIVSAIGASKIAITPSWAKYTVSATLPSIAGKTLGTGHYTQIAIWFDAGSDYNVRASWLGNQSGTFDIANVQLNYGSVALPFVPRSFAEELRLCQRYYLPDIARSASGVMSSGQAYFYPKCPTPVTMRTTPTLTLVTADCALLSNGQVLIVSSISGVAIFSNGIYFGLVMSGNATENCVAALNNTVINADAEL